MIFTSGGHTAREMRFSETDEQPPANSAAPIQESSSIWAEGLHKSQRLLPSFLNMVTPLIGYMK
jgi:hypothetical protein